MLSAAELWRGAGGLPEEGLREVQASVYLPSVSCPSNSEPEMPVEKDVLFTVLGKSVPFEFQQKQFTSPFWMFPFLFPFM